MEATDKKLIAKFVNTPLFTIWQALEESLSELGIMDAVPGVYELDDQFTIILQTQQDKARKYLSEHYPKIK